MSSALQALTDLLFDQAGVGLCLVAPGGAVLRANAEWLRATGLDESQALGTDIVALFPATRELALALHARARAGEHVVVPRHAQWIDGRKTWWEGTIDPVPMEGGVGLLIGAREVTSAVERERAEEELREANAKLREQDRRKDEFLALLGHELRNPLSPIRNAAHVLEHADPAGEQAARARAALRRQSEHLTRLVDDLLDVTRITRGKFSLRRSRLDLREAAARAVEDFRATMAARGIALGCELPEGALWAEADATRVNQVVTNLLHNAAKFTPRGGEVAVSLRRAGGEAELCVRDSGVGVEPELLPRLFEPFTQDARALDRNEGGLGLGLALVKGIVELHGGAVSAESDGVGAGTRFLVRLPLAGAGEPAGAPGTLEDPPRGGRRVLVVDDNRDAAESLADLLRLHGHQVDVAFDGQSALARIETAPLDAVLCDLGMPGISGYELARRVRAWRPGRPRLIAVSGYAQAEDVERAIAAGFDAHLAKPPDPDQIARLLA